jgi:formate-dependent nitrite reductase membrane component NrfD
LQINERGDLMTGAWFLVLGGAAWFLLAIYLAMRGHDNSLTDRGPILGLVTMVVGIALLIMGDS